MVWRVRLRNLARAAPLPRLRAIWLKSAHPWLRSTAVCGPPPRRPAAASTGGPRRAADGRGARGPGTWTWGWPRPSRPSPRIEASDLRRVCARHCARARWAPLWVRLDRGDLQEVGRNNRPGDRSVVVQYMLQEEGSDLDEDRPRADPTATPPAPKHRPKSGPKSTQQIDPEMTPP